MLKIVQLVENCETCPNRRYYSGGIYQCEKKAGYNDLPDDHRKRMPGWCPLVDYPTAAALSAAQPQGETCVSGSMDGGKGGKQE